MPSPTPPQALKVLVTSSSLSASADISAWVGGLETAGDISNLWFVFRRPCSTPPPRPARTSRETSVGRGRRVPNMNGDLLVIRSNFSIKRSDFGIMPGQMEEKVSDTNGP